MHFQQLLKQIDEELKNEVSPLYFDYLFSSLDITVLNTNISAEEITNFIEKIASLQTNFPGCPSPAAVCLYSVWATKAQQLLKGKNVRIATVGAGFPHGQMISVSKLKDIIEICQLNVDEIDVVMNVPYFLSGKYEKISDEITAMKDIMGSTTQLKVILETQFLGTECVYDAARLALEAGADFIKTSTGKEGSVASPEGFFEMCRALADFKKDTGKQRGIKAAGGIGSAQQALVYVKIAEEMLGKEALQPETFRIGASKLANDILYNLAGLKNWNSKLLPYF